MGELRIQAEEGVAGELVLIPSHERKVAARDLPSDGRLVKSLPRFVRIATLMHALEVSLFTAANKALSVALEFVPA